MNLKNDEASAEEAPADDPPVTSIKSSKFWGEVSFQNTERANLEKVVESKKIRKIRIKKPVIKNKEFFARLK